MLLGYVAFFGVAFVCDELELLGHVARAEVEDTIGRQSVASGSAGFLIVAFDILGHILVDDVADIGFVDTHAEGDCGANDFNLVADEGVLVFGAFERGHSGVIGEGFNAVLAEAFGERFGGFARVAIDDSAFEGFALDEAEDLLEYSLFVLDPIGEVGAIEACDEGLRVFETKLSEDIAPNAIGRGGGERHEWKVGKEAPQIGELAVLGTEVVTPFANAVGFVDGESIDLPLLQVIEKAGKHETFRSNVEDGVLASKKLGVAFSSFGFVERRVEVSCVDAIGFKAVDLVLHQGDEWGDDDG